jgi:hypothetical protein
MHSQPERKFKQKAQVMRKKLTKAEQALAEEQKTIELMRSELFDAELNAIESQVERLEKRWKHNPASLTMLMQCDIAKLFLDERETLNRMIRANENTLRAQNLLDRILQLITQLSSSIYRE